MTSPTPAAQQVPPPDADLAGRYVSGTVTVAEALVVEQAMARSPAWRGLVGAQVDQGRLDANLALVNVDLDAPRRAPAERVMVRLGLPEQVARLMSATPVLRRSWYLASALVLFFALVAAGNERDAPTVAYFLALAPVVPVLGVGVAYGPGLDPAYDMTVATPVSGLRLLLLRSTAVLATSAVAGGIVSLLLVADHGFRVIAWLLPAVALTALSLLLATVLPTRVAASVTGGAWLLLVALVARNSEELRLFDPGAQVVYLVIAAVALGGVVLRRSTFESAVPS